ncbi:unnamed protein product [Sympodiomycopsis kandeliae]
MSASTPRTRRQSTREPSIASSSRRSTSIDVIVQEEEDPAYDNEEHDPDPDDSTGRRRKSRPEINRRVPQHSFAYGAPSDGTTQRKRSIGGRQSGGSGNHERDASASVSLTPSPSKSNAQLPPPQPQPQSLDTTNPPSAAQRYAALKARKQQASKQQNAGPPASTSSSIPTASYAADEHEPETEEEDAHGNTRKSSAPPEPSLPVGPSSISSASSSSRSRTTAPTTTSSIFMRDRPSLPAASLSPGPEDRSRRPIMSSSLLRGAQKQVQTPIPPLLSPRRRGAAMGFNLGNTNDGDSIRSSENSYSYASEEAYVQRNQQQQQQQQAAARSTAREVTPPARPLQALFEKISPWRNNTNGNSRPNGNGAHTADSDEEGEADANASTRTAKRRPRTSGQDQTYRPPKDFEIDDEDDEDDLSSDGGKRTRRKSGRKSGGQDTSARGGRDDNRIWKTTRRRRGKKQGRPGEEGDSILDDDDGSDVDITEMEAEEVVDSLLQTDKSSKSRASSQGGLVWTSLKWLLIATLGFGFANYLSGGGDSQTLEDSLSSTGRLSWIPLIGSSSSSTRHRSHFKPPADLPPPSDFEAFVQRLVSLESNVGSLSSATSSLLDSQSDWTRRLGKLELSSETLMKLAGQIGDRQRSDQDRLQSKLKELEDVGSSLRKQHEQLERQLASVESSTKQDRQKVQEQLFTLQKDVKRNEGEIARVLTVAIQADKIANEAKDHLRPLLEMNLPAQLPVKIDSRSGKPVIEGWFYEALKGVLGPTKAGEGLVPSTFDWNTFQLSNEASLRELIGQESRNVFDTQRAKYSILSRSDFLDLLSKELDGMKGVLEEKFNENAQGLQNDILSKVRSQQQMYEDSGSWPTKKTGSKGGVVDSSAGSLPGVDDISLSHIQTKDGSDATGAILTLIDAALESYSADRINRPDYALFSAGGRIIPSLTSPTYEFSHPKGPVKKKYLPWTSTAVETYSGRTPVHALHPDNSPGMCWSFKGSIGQLGIRLSKPIVISDISIDHPSLSILPEGGGDTAPREISISGYLESDSDRKRYAEYQSTKSSSEEEFYQVPTSMPNYIHLSTFTYSLDKKAVQTFAIQNEAVRVLQLPISILQVTILSNYGNQEFTCLYRVRVHGDTVNDK